VLEGPDAEFVREAQRSELRVLAGVLSGSFDGVDESASNVSARFAEVVVHCGLEVRRCEVVELNGSRRHQFRCPLRYGHART